MSGRRRKRSLFPQNRNARAASRKRRSTLLRSAALAPKLPPRFAPIRNPSGPRNRPAVRAQDFVRRKQTARDSLKTMHLGPVRRSIQRTGARDDTSLIQYPGIAPPIAAPATRPPVPVAASPVSSLSRLKKRSGGRGPLLSEMIPHTGLFLSLALKEGFRRDGLPSRERSPDSSVCLRGCAVAIRLPVREGVGTTRARVYSTSGECTYFSTGRRCTHDALRFFEHVVVAVALREQPIWLRRAPLLLEGPAGNQNH